MIDWVVVMFRLLSRLRSDSNPLIINEFKYVTTKSIFHRSVAIATLFLKQCYYFKYLYFNQIHSIMVVK